MDGFVQGPADGGSVDDAASASVPSKEPARAPPPRLAKIPSRRDLKLKSLHRESSGPMSARWQNAKNSARMRNKTPRERACTGRALVVVGMQQDIFSDLDGAKYPLQGATCALVNRVNELRRSVDWQVVVWTRDTFVSNHAVFSSNLPETNDFKGRRTHGEPDHCMLGSKGAELHPDVDRRRDDVVVDSGFDATTIPVGCSDSDLVLDDNILLKSLKAAGITHVYVCGVEADTKVKEVALQAAEFAPRGLIDFLNLTLVTDLCVPRDPVAWHDALSDCAKEGISTVESGPAINLLSEWSAPDDWLRQWRDDEEKWVELRHALYRTAAVQNETRSAELDSVLQRVSNVDKVLSKHGSSSTKVKMSPLNARPPPAGWGNTSNFNHFDRQHPVSGLSVIHQLCCMGTSAAVDIIKSILDSRTGSPTRRCALRRMSPLDYACAAGNVGMVRMLLNGNKQSGNVRVQLAASSSGTENSERDARGYTAVLHAIENTQKTCVETVAALGGVPIERLLDVVDRYGRTVSMIAAEAYSHSTEGKVLFNSLRAKFPPRCLSPHACDLAKWSIWHYAVRHNLHWFLVSEIPADPGPNEMALPLRRQTPSDFMRARVSITDTATLAQNDMKHAMILRSTARNGLTMLHLAAQSGSKGVLEHVALVCRRVGCQNLSMHNGKNALDIALEHLDPEHAFVLVRSGCTPEFYRHARSQASPLMLFYKALFLGEATVMRILLTDHGFSLHLDRSMFSLGINQTHVGTCSKLAAGTMRSSWVQPWFKVNGSGDMLVCTVCALRCHVADSITFDSISTGRCACTSIIAGCACTARDEHKSTWTGCVDVPTLNVRPAHLSTVLGDIERGGANTRHHRVESGSGDSSRQKSHRKRRSIARPTSGVTLARSVSRHGLATANGVNLKKEPGKNNRHMLVEVDENVALQVNCTHREYMLKVFLLSAASYGQAEIVEELTKLVDTVEFVGIDESLENPIHLAARFNQVQACEILVASLPPGARLAARNQAGATCLTIAAAFGFEKICRVVATEANTVILDMMGLSPLHHAVRNNHPAVVTYLAHQLCMAKYSSSSKSLGHRMLNELYVRPGKRPGKSWRKGRFQSRGSYISSQGSVVDNSISSMNSMHNDNDHYTGGKRRGGSHGSEAGQGGLNGTGKVRSSSQRHFADMSFVEDKVFLARPGEAEAHASPLHLAVRYGHRECVQALIAEGAYPLHKDGTTFSSYNVGLRFKEALSCPNIRVSLCTLPIIPASRADLPSLLYT